MVDSLTLREQIERRAAASAHTYRAQRAYVRFMFDLIGRLLVASSESDLEVARELEGFREGYTIGFSVWGDPVRMRVGVKNGKFVRQPNELKPELEIVFKHVSHAFAVLSFAESTAQAYANERMLTHGDTPAAMRFVRCLNRVQAVALPRFVANRAIKSVPEFAMREKVALVTNLYGRVARGLVG